MFRGLITQFKWETPQPQIVNRFISLVQDYISCGGTETFCFSPTVGLQWRFCIVCCKDQYGNNVLLRSVQSWPAIVYPRGLPSTEIPPANPADPGASLAPALDTMLQQELDGAALLNILSMYQPAAKSTPQTMARTLLWPLNDQQP